MSATAKKMEEAAEAAARSGHPDNTEGMRIFLAKVTPLFPKSAIDKLSPEELQTIFHLMKVCFSQGFNAAYDLAEPERRLADTAMTYLDVLKARGSATKKADALKAMKEAAK